MYINHMYVWCLQNQKWVLILGPLQKQLVLLTSESSLQCHFFITHHLINHINVYSLFLPHLHTRDYIS